MLVGVTVVELHIPECRSLKGKRKVVKSLVERLHQRYKVSVIESDFHDLHQRAEIAIAMVARTESEIEKMNDEMRRLVEFQERVLVTLWDDQLLEMTR